MFCENCGSQLPEGSKFCLNCGAKAAVEEAAAAAVEESAAATETIEATAAESEPATVGPEPVYEQTIQPPAPQPEPVIPVPQPVQAAPASQPAPQPRPVQPAPQPQTYQQPVPPVSQPAIAQKPEKVNPLSAWKFIGILLLEGIPVIGFIMILVWSFGKSFNKNTRSYARAVLILGLIKFGFVLAFVIINWAFVSYVWNSINSVIDFGGYSSFGGIIG